MCASNSLSHSAISLSDQESVILRCFALGMGNEYVCKTLAISTIELNAYLRVLMAKFGVQNQYHLIKKAFRKGFMDPSNFVLEECKRTCPYSGKEISLELLYTPHVKIVFIHPWSRSLNDSRMNKTLCITEIADQLNAIRRLSFHVKITVCLLSK